jgi:S-methylmethionine-dependent homocysteine/selenocysteine methylase
LSILFQDAQFPDDPFAFTKAKHDTTVQWRDAEISPVPRHYMIGCLYPTHAQTALRALRTAQSALVERVRGLKANASALPPEDLDKLNHLAATDVQMWARNELSCAREFNLAILGGCCGTDERYIEALAKAAVDQGESVR